MTEEIKFTSRYQELIDKLSEIEGNKLFYPYIPNYGIYSKIESIIDEYKINRSKYEEFLLLFAPNPESIPELLSYLKGFVVIFIEGGRVHSGGNFYPIWLLVVDSCRFVGRDTVSWLFGEYGSICDVLGED